MNYGVVCQRLARFREDDRTRCKRGGDLRRSRGARVAVPISRVKPARAHDTTTLQLFSGYTLELEFVWHTYTAVAEYDSP